MSTARSFLGARRCSAFLFALVIIAMSSGTAFAQDDLVLPVSELLASPNEYEGTSVEVEGELVGDYGFRRDGSVWTQLNDDSYARTAVVDGGELTGSNVGIGVRMTASLAEGLDPPGGYRIEGPLVRLTGVWRYHDPDRSGESYLDVTAVEVVEQGRRLEEGPDWVVFVAGTTLVAVAGAMWLQARRSRNAAVAHAPRAR